MAGKTLLTVEQFEQLPDDGMRHELDEGELVSTPPAFGLHGMTHGSVAQVLGDFVESTTLGMAFCSTGFRLGPNTVRAPDVSFLRAERARSLDPDQRFECAPDLAVEVISPSESASDIAHKVGQYLRAGAIVWVVYPKDRSVHVFEPSKTARVLDANDILDAPALLPGFSVPVSELFG